MAYRIITEDPANVVKELAEVRREAIRAEERARADLRVAASMIIDRNSGKGARGIRSKAGFAAAAGIDRMLVLEWLGLRA